MFDSLVVRFMGKEVVALTIDPFHLRTVWLEGGLYSVVVKAHFVDGSKKKTVHSPDELVADTGVVGRQLSCSEIDRLHYARKEKLLALFEAGFEILRLQRAQ